MEELLKRLKLAGYGCWIGNYYFGAICYADDMTLLSPSAHGLQCMINICEDFAIEYSMEYNVSKSVCLLFSKKSLNVGLPNITLSQRELSWVSKVKHLGNYISGDLSEEHEIRLKRGDLVGRAQLMINYRNATFTTQYIKYYICAFMRWVQCCS